MPDNLKRQFRISLIIIGASFILFSLAIYWLGGMVNSLAGGIFEEKALIQQRSILNETLAILKKDAGLAQNYKKGMELLVPTKEQLLVGLSGWLDSQEKLFNVDSNLSFRGSEVAPTEDSLGRVGFTMNVSGEIQSLVRFLKGLEVQSPRFLMNFDSMDISRDQGRYQVIAVGSVFFGK